MATTRNTKLTGNTLRTSKELAPITLRKVSSLKKNELAKIVLEDLWVMQPQRKGAAVRARYCGCRNVCLV